MMVNSFINQPDESIKQISGPAPAYQSFTERKKLERQRQIVRGYRDSHLGNAYGVRGRVRADKRAEPADNSRNNPRTRQSVNAQSVPVAKPVGIIKSENSVQSQRFSEPPSRSYNPFG